MRTKATCILIAALSIGIFSCNSSRERMEEKASIEKAKEDSLMTVMSSSAAVETGRDTTRKFIRTAQMKFRVKNVITTTYRVEDLVGDAGGYVSYTNLHSDIDYKTITPVSADSLLETLHYTVSDEMTLRVPNTKLDSLLKAMARYVDYLDYRIIKANDVSLQIITNRMSRARMDKHEERLEKAIDTKGLKPNEKAYAEDRLFNKEAQADAATIATISMQDQVDYSTVSLTIYQREGVKRTVIANDKNIDAYEPGMGLQLLDALKLGWKMLVKLLVLVADCWALVALAVGLFLLFRKYGERLKKKD